MSRYLLERVVCGTSGATVFGGTTEFSISDELEAVLDAGASELDPTQLTIERESGHLEFTTLDVGVAANALFALGVPTIRCTSAAPALLYCQQLADGGTRTGAGANIIFKVVKGALVLGRLRGGPRCTLSIRIDAAYDGTNVAIQKLTGQNLASGVAGAAAIWRLVAVKDNTTAIPKITEAEIDFGVGVDRLNPANGIQVRDQVVSAFAPTGSFTTTALATALTLSNFNGAACGAAGLQFILVPYDTSTGLPASSGGIAFVFRAGSMYAPNALAASRGGNKSCSFRVIGKGGTAITNYPITLSTGVTPPTESTTDESFMPGPAVHNTTKPELDEWTFDFGTDLRAETPPANLLWPTTVYVATRMPRGEFKTFDLDWVAGLGETGSAIDTAFYFYLRKLNPDIGVPYPDASAVHIRLTITAGNLVPRRAGGSHRGTLTGEVSVIAKYNGTDAIAAFASGVAIA